MKEKIQHRLLILFLLTVIVGGISLFLNNLSFNPDFSVMDAVTGATKKSHPNENSGEVISTWNYTKEDLALPEENSYTETQITAGKVTYRVLENSDKKNKAKKVTLLSNKEDVSYQNAVQDVAAYLKDQGYDIQIKECTETMMLSMVHAGNFTFFVMDEEVLQ